MLLDFHSFLCQCVNVTEKCPKCHVVLFVWSHSAIHSYLELFLLFQLRIEGMLLKVEFKVNCDDLRTELGTLISVCTAVLESESLKQFLRYVLHTGNFINSVSTYKQECIPVGCIPSAAVVVSGEGVSSLEGGCLPKLEGVCPGGDCLGVSAQGGVCLPRGVCVPKEVSARGCTPSPL